MNGSELSVILLASAIGMFVKSVTGMGYPLFAIPLISLVVGVEHAVVIVSAPNVVANAILCWRARAGMPDSRDLLRLGASGVLGSILGTKALMSLPEWPLLLLLVLTIVVFVFQYWRAPEMRMSAKTSHRWSPLVGTVAGLMQGAVGVSGPVVAAWIHGYRLERNAQVFSVTLLFLLSGLAQVAFFVGSGAYTSERVSAATLVLIPVLFMIPIGTRVRDRLSGPGFDRAVLGVLVVSAIALVIRMLSG